jgi:hypothetical protein
MGVFRRMLEIPKNPMTIGSREGTEVGDKRGSDLRETGVVYKRAEMG